MSVNQMQIEDVYAVLNSIHGQVTGLNQPNYVNVSNFVSVANTMLQQNTDAVYSALMNTIAKTIFSTRPYSRQFGGMIVDNIKWGGIIRKVQFGDTDAVADKAFHDITDGQSVDHYIVNKGDVLETRYYGSAVYQDVMTVFRDQLINAFTGPEQLGSFIAAKANEVNNKWTQWTEDLARGLIFNAVYAKTQYYGNTSLQGNDANKGHVYHLLTMYNDLTGESNAYSDIFTPGVSKAFWEWVRATIRTLQRDFTARNSMHYTQISGHNIIRHTPYDKQKVYLLAPYMDLMETSTLTEAFHNDMLQYSDYEGVAYWQSPALTASNRSLTDSYDSIAVSKYVVLDPATGQYENKEYDTDFPPVRKVLGIIFDEDMMSINIKDTIIQNTPMNARGLYFNTWLSAHASYLQDFTEKCCILMLD